MSHHIHGVDHSVAVTSMITIHQVIKAGRMLVEELPEDRLSDWQAAQFELMAKTIRKRLNGSTP